jgi:hypothetical protein
MVNRPSVPEVITVNSEALQTQIRDLLPSQNGFGSELQATNVITPIIDLTSTAEGSGLPTNLQQALAFGSQTAFSIAGATTTIANSPGFYRIFGMSNVLSAAAGGPSTNFVLTDGLAAKTVWRHIAAGTTAGDYLSIQYDFIVFLAAGESLNGISNNASCFLDGSSRQIATGDGTLVQPNGFPL